MLEYLAKFNNLPADVKQKVSTGAVLVQIGELETKYGTPLSSFVMRIMVGDLYYKNIAANLIIENNLSPEKASALEKELKEKIFAAVMDFLTGKKTAPVFDNTDNKPSKLPVVKGPEAIVVRRAPVSAVAVSNFLEEDKKDLSARQQPSAAENIQKAGQDNDLEEIIKEAGISFASQTISGRFKDVLSTYLRGIRTKAEARERLVKEIANGGVGLEAEEVDRILAIAQKKISGKKDSSVSESAKVGARTAGGGTNFIFNQAEIKQALREKSAAPGNKIDSPAGSQSKPAVSAIRDIDYNFSASAKIKSSAVEAEGKGKLGSEVSLAGKAFSPAKAEPILSKIDLPKKEISKAAPAPEPEAVEVKEKDANRMAAVSGNKKRMDDIKVAPKTMSPVDELAYMDLVNFRRLDQDPARRTAKIEEKIALLEREGIEKKIAGVKAWRGNPVNRTYLSMGQESIGGGRNINDVIKDRQEKGLNCLSQEEFDAIMDLNNNLRF